MKCLHTHQTQRCRRKTFYQLFSCSLQSTRRLQCPSKLPADHTLLSSGSIPYFGLSCKEDPSKPLFLIHLKSLFYCIWNPTLANLSAQWIIFQLTSPTVRMCLPVAFFPLSRIYLAKCSPSSALPLSHRAVSSEHNFQQSSFTQPQIFRNRDESKAKGVTFTEYFYIWNSIHWLLFEPSPLKSPKWHLRAAEIKQSSKKGISCHGPGWLLCAGSTVTALLTAHLVCARDAVRSLQTSNEFSCQFCKARTIQ